MNILVTSIEGDSLEGTPLSDSSMFDQIPLTALQDSSLRVAGFRQTIKENPKAIFQISTTTSEEHKGGAAFLDAGPIIKIIKEDGQSIELKASEIKSLNMIANGSVPNLAESSLPIPEQSSEAKHDPPTMKFKGVPRRSRVTILGSGKLQRHESADRAFSSPDDLSPDLNFVIPIKEFNKIKQQQPEEILSAILEAKDHPEVSIVFKNGKRVDGVFLFQLPKHRGRILNLDQTYSVSFSFDDIKTIEIKK
ncbi:MAG: hypothetical protein SGJ02_02605 [bacterium]|nr:hypothetical protein [bacterium]